MLPADGWPGEGWGNCILLNINEALHQARDPPGRPGTPTPRPHPPPRSPLAPPPSVSNPTSQTPTLPTAHRYVPQSLSSGRVFRLQFYDEHDRVPNYKGRPGARMSIMALIGDPGADHTLGCSRLVRVYGEKTRLSGRGRSGPSGSMPAVTSVYGHRMSA